MNTEKPLDWTKPLQFRDPNYGSEIKVVADDIGDVNSQYPIIVTFKTPYGYKAWNTYRKDGHLNGCGNNSADIINIPQKIKIEAWLNLYSDGRIVPWKTKELADEYGISRIACEHFVREIEI